MLNLPSPGNGSSRCSHGHASIMHFPCFPVIHPDDYSGAQKLHNESGNAKHGKEKNWEKKESNKENNREKKEKNKKRLKQQDKLDHSVHKKKKLRHDQGSEFFESFRDWKKDASERSCLTEEQELSSSVPNPCNSLESTQNSSKKNKLLVADTKRKNQGLVLRIKLPLMKHKEPVTANTSTEPCSSCEAVAITDIIPPSPGGKASSCLKVKTSVLHSTPANEDPCFSGRVTEGLMIEGGAATDFISSNCGSSSNLEMEKCFSDLILNWKPSSLQSYDLYPGSQDWLFAPRQPPQSNHSAMRCKASKPDHEVGLISASSLQPQACYLPEFDIYQLPYVIPF